MPLDFSIKLLPSPEEELVPEPPDQEPAPNSPERWTKLGELLVDRRSRINADFKNRTKFCEVTGLNERLVADLETARRRNYRPGSLSALEKAYRLSSGSITRYLNGGTLIETADVSASASLAISSQSSPDQAATGYTATENRAWLNAAVRQFAARLPAEDVAAILEEYAPVPEIPEGSASFVDLSDPVERQIWRIAEMPVMWREQLIGVLRQMRLIAEEEEPSNDNPGTVAEFHRR